MELLSPSEARVLLGTAMDAVGRDAMGGDWPDDLRVRSDGPISATVEIAEYHGRDYYALAKGNHGKHLTSALNTD